MPVTLTVDQVESLTGAVVSENDITLAQSLIDSQTGHTPSEHVDERLLSSLQVQAAWSLVAVRIHRMLNADDLTAVTSETQGDYTYAESVTLAQSLRWSNVVDGRPQELLNLSRARWVHL